VARSARTPRADDERLRGEGKRRVVVRAHDPAWRLEFEQEAARISRALGELEVSLHHIGSTAIPGIPAKPIIDVLMVVAELVELDAKNSVLADLGYEALGEFGIPGRRFFRRSDESGVRTHHVHAFEVRDPGIERHLAFRDYMIAHPAEARMYGELKRGLALRFPEDVDEYMRGKDAFIKEHEARALAWRLPLESSDRHSGRPAAPSASQAAEK